jgi:hypothetical protein
MARILWFIIVVLFAFWLIGVIAHIASGLIHILLVVALIVFLYNVFIGNRRVRD